MAENVRETRPPEPPPKPPEVPKPTEQSSRAEAKDHGQPNESQQSAQQDARNAAQSEHAKATSGREPEGLQPTPEFQERLDEHTAAKNGLEGLRPTPEFQERLDAHTAAKAERDTATPQDSAGVERPRDSSAAQRSEVSGNPQRPQDSQAAQRPPEAAAVDRNTAAPAGEQAGEYAAARAAAAAERANAIGDTALLGEGPRPQSIQDANQPALDNGQPRDPDRVTQPPERSRHDDPVPTSPQEESATARQPADQNMAQRQPAVDEDSTHRQSAVDEDSIQRQPAVEDNALPRQGAVDENPQHHPAVDHTVPQQTVGAQGSADEVQARPAETTDESTPQGVTPTGNETGDNPPRPQEDSYSEPVDDIRDQPQTTPPDNTETDKSAETAARLNELRDEGHGPQRHHDPTNDQLAARMGDPILDPQTGQPELKGNGHVKAQNHIDPMTGTTVDGVHGGTHRCGDYATRFDSAEDYVAADRFMRNRVSDNQPVVKAPISDVLGPDGHDRVTGYYRDPAAPGELKPVDFTGGNIVAVYNRNVNGDLTLYTMYPDPVPFHPNQPGGTVQ